MKTKNKGKKQLPNIFQNKFLKIKNKNVTNHNLIFKDYQPNNIISVEPKFIHRTDLKKKKKKLITCQLITLGVTRTASSFFFFF